LEPNRHLRLTEIRDRAISPVEEKMTPCRLVQDFFLESAAGGKTLLRLVHSGLGDSAGWDNEYEGTRGGWQACFLQLRHGLELHRGEKTENWLVAKMCPGMDGKTVLDRLEALAPEGCQVALRTPMNPQIRNTAGRPAQIRRSNRVRFRNRLY